MRTPHEISNGIKSSGRTNTVGRIDKLSGLEMVIETSPEGRLISVMRGPPSEDRERFSDKHEFLQSDDKKDSFPDVRLLYGPDLWDDPYILNFIYEFPSPLLTVTGKDKNASIFFRNLLTEGYDLEEEINERIYRFLDKNRDLYVRFLKGKEEGIMLGPKVSEFIDFFDLERNGSHITYRPVGYVKENFGTDDIRTIDYFQASEGKEEVKDWSVVPGAKMSNSNNSNGWKKGLKWGAGLLAAAAIGVLGYLGLKSLNDDFAGPGDMGPAAADTVEQGDDTLETRADTLADRTPSLSAPTEYDVSIGDLTFTLSESEYQRITALSDEQILEYGQRGAIGIIEGVFGQEFLAGKNVIRRDGMADNYLADINIDLWDEDDSWEQRHIPEQYRNNGYNDQLSSEDALRLYHDAILPSIKEEDGAGHNPGTTELRFDGSGFHLEGHGTVENVEDQKNYEINEIFTAKDYGSKPKPEEKYKINEIYTASPTRTLA